ncbi:hypothetical protein EIN_118270 [Entamoeba invadens IP1]|uniref:Uncharacterized protein n=2 Tax=Entamoeba invadens TaxID=33085 RepID=L7FMT8_ENTIV|nr:hypothetical protein EIN_118270 [Entamoeba invadens IP1]ELP92253.1 hypothetical protein EIN_118270 [Entamoeba invadens IP1]BAN40939.1 hypothetical protein [Entamoeba invadens]BAN40963.1 hypothetical protein [Entamoeba invadens]|eukprot:XP_004259024.1 hypothetical protein EIN_118270 [Entamoeba invadens IP1]
MLLFLLFISFTFSLSVEPINWTRDTTYNNVVSHIYFNENSQNKYTAALRYDPSTPLAITIDMFHPKLSQKTIKVTASSVVRPQVSMSTSKLFFLNDGNVEVWNVSTASPTPLKMLTLTGVDKNSPLALLEKNFTANKPSVFLYMCKDSKIAIYDENLKLVQQTGFPCGRYMSVGNNILAVKNTTLIEIYTVGSTGALTVNTQTEITGTSESVMLDPMIVSKADIIYSVVSDQKKIQVNSPNNYKTAVFIENVTFYDNTAVSTEYAPILNSLGCFIVVGRLGAKSGVNEVAGAVTVYFDKYFTSGLTDPKRFEKMHEVNGTATYFYKGYSVAMTEDTLYVGGKVNYLTNGSLQGLSNNVTLVTQKCCTNGKCFCQEGYYYVDSVGKCLLNVAHKKNRTLVYILAGVGIGLLLLFLIIIVVIIVVMSKRNEKKKVDEESGPILVPSAEGEQPKTDDFKP